MSVFGIKEEEKHILNVLPLLLRKDGQFKETLYEVLGETFTEKDDFAKLKEWAKEIEEEQKKIEARLTKVEAEVKKMVENQKKSEEEILLLAAAVKKLVEDQKRTEIKADELAKAQKRTQDKIEKLAEVQKQTEVKLRNIKTTLEGIGAGWEIITENLFTREGLANIEFKTATFKIRDEEGIILDYPAEVELDIGIQDGKIFIREIKPSINNSDVYIFN